MNDRKKHRDEIEDLNQVLAEWAARNPQLDDELKLRMVASTTCAIRSQVTGVSLAEAIAVEIELLHSFQTSVLTEPAGGS